MLHNIVGNLFFFLIYLQSEIRTLVATIQFESLQGTRMEKMIWMFPLLWNPLMILHLFMLLNLSSWRVTKMSHWSLTEKGTSLSFALGILIFLHSLVWFRLLLLDRWKFLTRKSRDFLGVCNLTCSKIKSITLQSQNIFSICQCYCCVPFPP